VVTGQEQHSRGASRRQREVPPDVPRRNLLPLQSASCESADVHRVSSADQQDGGESESGHSDSRRLVAIDCRDDR
jgi:hypothetical protein